MEMNKPAFGSCDGDMIYNRLTGSSGNKQTPRTQGHINTGLLQYGWS